MAVMSATLANGGTCPITLDPVIKPEAVRDVLSLLHSCGFYEYSGQFAFKVKTKIRRSVEDSTILHKLDAEFCLQCSLAPAENAFGNSPFLVYFRLAYPENPAKRAR